VHDSDRRPGWRGWAGKAALAVGGLLVGGVLVGTLTANAATSSTQSAAAAGSASTQESRATFPAHGTPAHENLEKPVTGRRPTRPARPRSRPWVVAWPVR
jgi:hypothetical protein